MQPNKGKNSAIGPLKPNSKAHSKGDRVNAAIQSKQTLDRCLLGIKNEANANPNTKVVSGTKKVSTPQNLDPPSSANTTLQTPNPI